VLDGLKASQVPLKTIQVIHGRTGSKRAPIAWGGRGAAMVLKRSNGILA